MTCSVGGLTGGKYCTAGNPEGVPTGIWFSPDDFSMDATSFLLKATFEAAVKAGNLSPIHGNLYKGWENANAETKFHEFANQSRSFMDSKKLRFSIVVDANECQEKQLHKFTGYTGRVFVEYGNMIRGMSQDADETIKGLRTSMVYVETGDFNMSDGTKGTVKINIDLLTETDKSKHGYTREMEWDTIDIDGLTEVDLLTVGTTTATELILDIASNCYGTTFGMSGLVLADFTITGTGTITSITESETVSGRYLLVTVGLANSDLINLVDAPSISVTDYFIQSGGALVVSGIA